jgi:hypothetical protein
MKALRIERLTLIVVTCLAIAMPSEETLAQQRLKVESNSEGQVGRYTQQLSIDVGDVPGHQVRVVDIHYTYNDKSRFGFKGVKVREGWARGYSDQVDGVGPAWGYVVYVLEDGDRVFGTYSGSAEGELTETGSRKGTYRGTTRFTGGTGKYKGLRGLMVTNVRYDTDLKQGYNISDSKGEYWFEE